MEKIHTNKRVDWEFSGLGISDFFIEGPIEEGLRLYKTWDEDEKFTTEPTCPYCGLKSMPIDEGYICADCQRRY